MGTPPEPNVAELEVARMLLARLGITAEQLLGSVVPRREIPTVGAYIDHVAVAVSPSTRSVYDTYWRKVREVWGDRPINQPTPIEISQLAQRVRGEVVVRRNSRQGRTAAEHLIGSLRCLYRYAVADGLILPADNPAARVPKPRRLASTRHGLHEGQVADIVRVAASTGNDPELDGLLIRLHLETACRRGGALALVRTDLDVEQCLIRLREKGETIRWQPVSPTLMRALVAHVDERWRPDMDSQVLRYRSGAGLTSRRYDSLWQRLGKHLPWVRIQLVSTHWLRYTTLTWVERHFGYAVARAYAGHVGKNDAGTTSTYVRADVHEVAYALSELVGEPHPLARAPVVGSLL